VRGANGVSTDGSGPTVVRAHVQARLLGIRLLVLDARVVVGRADETDGAMLRVRSASSVPPPRREPAALHTAGPPGLRTGDGLGVATDLVQESARTLDHCRRARSAL
jgi:hypothetical protein